MPEILGTTVVHVCGRLSRAEAPPTAASVNARHVRQHWRRGHWHNQAYGQGRAFRKLQWRMPVLVNSGDAGETRGRIYTVASSA